MTYLRTIMCLCALAGCAGTPTEVGAPLPVGRVRQSLAEWQAHGLQPGHCAGIAGDVRVLITTSDEVSDRCGQPVQACTAGDLIVISQEYMGVYSYILEHELHHWMAQCAYNMGDAEHRNPQLWYGGVGVEDIWALEP